MPHIANTLISNIIQILSQFVEQLPNTVDTISVGIITSFSLTSKMLCSL